MPENLLASPSLTATLRETPFYGTLGVGQTDRLFLLGHSDNLELNDPYPVANVQAAINALGADTNSPLLIAFLEAIYAGARDIWLVAVAPMSEYEPDITARNSAYYATYRDRLDTTYALLKSWGVAQIVVPIDAPFNSTVDFLTPLITFCKDSYETYGNVTLGLLGTRGIITPPLVDALCSDNRLGIGSWGKFVAIFVGDVTINLKELPIVHSTSAVVLAAAKMTQLPLDRGLTYTKLPNAISTVGPDLSDDQLSALSNAKLNPIRRTTIGKRGRVFEVVVSTDNTLGLDGSDFWSLVQMRLICRISNQVKDLGTRQLGIIGLSVFRSEVDEYLTSLTVKNVIRTYTLDMQRLLADPTKVIVNIGVTPYFGLRELSVTVEVGPDEQ